MLDNPANRLALNVAGLGNDRGPCVVNGEDDAAGTKGKAKFVGRKGHMDEFCTTAIDNGGNLAGPTQFTGGTLAELGSRGGGDGNSRHEHSPCTSVNLGEARRAPTTSITVHQCAGGTPSPRS